MHGEAMKNRFIELRAQGMSFKSIADKTGVSKRTLISWASDIHISAKIAVLKLIEFEALQEDFGVMTKQRHEFVAKWLQRAKEELEKRSLENLSTGKLISFINRCDDHMKETLEWLVLKAIVPKRSCNSDYEDMEDKEEL